ncbi:MULTISPECIES: acyl carrier protein [Streptomyces]|jgi:acyl carrier protein|uniref:acyl carrier protein n=1 Tax=Streptomyces TaxID=1883 RepID=UPI0024419011|nr:acyl carrier protein [Streptomyces sp. DH10]MDG9708982.1 acyl carrier protein [Streptomyces sp. DH10]
MTDDITKTVRSFIGEHVQDGEPGDDHDIFATGSVSSLFAVQLVMWVERTFGITVHPTDLDIENFRTVNHVVRFVESRRAAAAPA